MSSKDSYNGVSVQRVLSPASVTDNTAQVCEIIDTQFYESLLFVIALGSLADADATFTVLIEDGDNAALTDNVAVVDDFLLGTEAAASFQFDDDNETRKIGYVGKKRYVRMTITPADNTGASLISVLAILGDARHNPVA